MKKLKKLLVLGVSAMVCCAALSGCGGETKTAEKGLGDSVKIGVLYSTTGAFSINETPMQNAAKMAIDEINAKGGINGKKIDAIYMDYGSDPTMAAQKAQELILKDGVCAIVGTNSSATRLAVIPTVEQNDSLLVYNTYYEGEKPSPNVLYTNSVPSQQIDAFVPWMMKNLGKRVFFAGTDYEFPKKSIAIAKKLVQDNGGVVVGEEYVPTTQTDFSSMINKIKEAKPDVVFSVVAGNAAVPFYKQYSQYGMDPKKVPICSISTSEATLKGIGAAAIGTYSSFDYFNTIDTPANKDFIKKYQEKFGTDTTVTNQAEGAYHGVYMLAAAIAKADSKSAADIIKAAAGLEIDTPAGKIKMDDTNHHAWLNSYIGKVNDNLAFDIVYQSDGLVKPVAE
ncbi:transporter substrate-binding domain-containing protein [Megasphaera paucivorans]|uniref:Branched-chain amino acid transport system substrate-binding protein n=1 Tax=Megasphaera paucivorans TaxID=349095 RepID=A0A1G9SFD9_9FIRM|nr:transporter substrate-binding domain-containing protein [Megasphaera paucivorans]SDM34122.1 branched-chain amino acid transport system substrate-binding protein [Megasphaera paucivorans]